MFRIVFEKQAAKDAKKLKVAGLERKAKELIEVIRVNPFQTPPIYEGLVGNLQGYYSRGFWSRRINDKDRLIYKIDESNVYILACRYHYSDT